MKTRVAFAFAALAVIACNDSPTAPPGGGGGSGATNPPAYLVLEPPHVTTPTHFPVQFALVLRDSGGIQIILDTPKTRPTWSVDDTTIATISSTGLISNLRPGLTHVRATWGGISGFAVLQVLPTVAHLAISPTSGDAYYDVPLHLTASPTDSNNVPLNRRAIWRSADSLIASVNDSGTVTAHQGGTIGIFATIDATSNFVVVRAHADHVRIVTVTSAGGATAVSVGNTVQYSVSLTGIDYPTSGFPITWTSTDTTKARIDQTGLATAVAPGPTSIVATAAGVADTLPLRVDPHVASVALVPETLQVTVGNLAREGLAAIARDSAGHPLPGHLIKFAVKDSTLTPFVDSVTLTAARVGSTTLYATADGVRDSGVVRTDTLSLVWFPNGGVNMDEGDPRFGLQLTGPALTPVSIRSSDTTVVQINIGDTVLNNVVGMHLDPRSPGVSIISAQVPGYAPVTFRASVYAPELVGFVIGPKPGAPFAPGDSLRLTAAEYSHNAQLYYPVTWHSSDTTVAAVDTSGLVTARAPGRAGIIGTAHGKADTARFYVRAPTAPAFASLSDSAINAGDTLTIKGSGLGATALDTVSVAGIPSTIVSAVDSQIVAVMPTPAQYTCGSPGPVRLRVSVGHEYRDTVISLAVAPVASPAVGDVLHLTGSPARCLSFPALGGVYLVGVTNTSVLTKAFQLQVDTAGQEQLPPSPDWPGAPLPSARGPMTVAGPALFGLNRMIAGRLRGVTNSLRMQQRRGLRALMGSAAAAAEAFTVGATTVFKVPVLDAPDPCSTYSQIQARVVYSGTHVVVMEDTDAPLAGQMDAGLKSLGQDFDGHVFTVLRTNLGDPLAAFPGGKIIIVTTPQANAYGTDAFAAGCDFYAPATAPSSNQAPVIYAAVPTDTGTGYQAFTAQAWQWAVPAGLVNVSAHLTTFGVRLTAGAPAEQAWLDEAVAEATVEIWDRQFSGVAWKQNAGYQASLYCEVRPAWPSCTGHPFAMFAAFETLYGYDETIGSSPLGTVPGDFTYEGGAWWLLRTTIDHYAGSESGFLSALVHEPSLTGLANLSARASAPAGTLLADWMVSSVGANDPDYATLPVALTTGSWNARDVFAGMSSDFPQQFNGFPLSLVSLGGTRTFYGGGSAVGQFGVSSAQHDALGLTSPTGGVADPALFITVVRVH